MRLRALVAVVAGVGIAVAVTSTASASSPVVVDRGNPAPPGGVMIPTHAGQALPVRGGTVDSLNWSGYAVTPSSDDITAVTSTFEVPEASAVPPACTGNSSRPAAPGDTVTVHIEQAGSGTWSIAVANPTEGGTWSKTVSNSSSQSSAQWILEAPTVITQTPLADVVTVHSSPTSTYTAGGTTFTAAQGDPIEIVLSPGVVNEATPSSIASDGQSFNDCAYAQTCAAP